MTVLRVVEHGFDGVRAILWGRPILVEFGEQRAAGLLLAHMTQAIGARR